MGTPPSSSDNTIPANATYDEAVKDLDIGAVFADLDELFTTSHECWPADEFGGSSHYGPMFIRLAWFVIHGTLFLVVN